MESVLVDSTQRPEIFREAYKSPNRKNANWVRAYQGYDAAIDWPTAAFFDTLYELNPDAKVILTVRDPEKWYQSMAKTIYEWPNVDETWPNQILEARKMARVVVRDGEIGENFLKRKEELKEKFCANIEHVKCIVKPENLLIMEVGEGWERLCQFLGKEVPSVPYPHCNDGNNFGLLLKKIKGLLEANEKESINAFINRMEDKY